MFSGIIKDVGEVTGVHREKGNLVCRISHELSEKVEVDQSIAHDGVCLTVEEVIGNEYRISAVSETLSKTNLSNWNNGTRVNLERSLKPDSHIDGHLVQGHADEVLKVVSVQQEGNSHKITLSTSSSAKPLLVPRGSIAVQGVSLTIAELYENSFSVAVIPYTWENTNLHLLRPGDNVNIEFDIIGKYVLRQLNIYRNSFSIDF